MNKTDKRFSNYEFDENEFPVIIEISKGSKNKYEIDKKTGLLRLDRILYTSTHYPHNYGYIPMTLSNDGDPIDVLVISSEPIIPFSFVLCRPIGVVKMVDSGKNDYKVLAISKNDPFYKNYENIDELPIHLVDEIEHFFAVYKNLEGKETSIEGIGEVDEAKRVIRESIDLFNENEL